MMFRILAAFAIAALSAPAFAQAAPPAPAAQAPAPKEDLVPIAIDTNLGRIVIALDRGHAPVTTANFLHYIDTHRFDGQVFYRAMHVPDADGRDGGLIQGGIRSDARLLYAPIAHEPTTKTGLHNVAGAISMANNGPGTARADFFILVSDMPGLDAGGPGGDANGFAAFGHVTEGMDVVRKIWTAPVSATKGEGAMKGQMLDPPVRILHAERVKQPPRIP
jgi:peptidyl-prolyl cis-trans isomerase A (cyclophilin A)